MIWPVLVRSFWSSKFSISMLGLMPSAIASRRVRTFSIASDPMMLTTFPPSGRRSLSAAACNSPICQSLLETAIVRMSAQQSASNVTIGMPVAAASSTTGRTPAASHAETPSPSIPAASTSRMSWLSSAASHEEGCRKMTSQPSRSHVGPTAASVGA